jgi:hypothetical protein
VRSIPCNFFLSSQVLQDLAFLYGNQFLIPSVGMDSLLSVHVFSWFILIKRRLMFWGMHVYIITAACGAYCFLWIATQKLVLNVPWWKAVAEIHSSCLLIMPLPRVCVIVC